MKRIGIIETALGCAGRPHTPGRMSARQIEPVLERLDSAGFYALDCWGGAAFDACLRYLGEDPWARLRQIKGHVRRTPLQMLLRGQSLVGYKQYPDDVVRAFVRRSRECGIDIFRVFDPLNDLRCLETAIAEALRAGARVSGAICFAVSPVHSLDTFMAQAKRLEQMGCHSVCVMDESGIMSPGQSYDLVYALVRSVSVPVIVHTHSPAGLGLLTAVKAVEAGAHAADCACAGYAALTGRPSTESTSYALGQMGFDSAIDLAVLRQINEFFRDAAQTPAPPPREVDLDALSRQMPSGMVRELAVRLAAQRALTRLPDVLAEVQLVRAELGFPPLVTPISQIIAAQAGANVLSGTRYANISKEMRALIAGEYGKPPGEIDRELCRRVLDGRNPAGVRFGGLLEPGMERAGAEIGHLARSGDDVLSYAVFPQLAEQFMKNRAAKR